MDELHGLVDEANVSMHEDLNVWLGAISLTEGETSSEVPQRAGSPELVCHLNIWQPTVLFSFHTTYAISRWNMLPHTQACNLSSWCNEEVVWISSVFTIISVLGFARMETCLKEKLRVLYQASGKSLVGCIAVERN